MKQLDLGVGGANRIEDGYEGYGVDIYAHERPWLKDNKVCDLAIDDIPYKSDMFDLVTAYDVLEHIPKVIFAPYHRNCMIELFNEVYRVLKNGGEFYFVVPKGGTNQYMGDPTHVTEWVEDSVNYYSGDYFGHHDTYGHTSKFKKISVEVDPQLSWRMSVRLKAIKPAEEPYDV
jgi:SAM-dependent methyltransferase